MMPFWPALFVYASFFSVVLLSWSLFPMASQWEALTQARTAHIHTHTYIFFFWFFWMVERVFRIPFRSIIVKNLYHNNGSTKRSMDLYFYYHPKATNAKYDSCDCQHPKYRVCILNAWQNGWRSENNGEKKRWEWKRIDQNGYRFQFCVVSDSIFFLLSSKDYQAPFFSLVSTKFVCYCQPANVLKNDDLFLEIIEVYAFTR